MVWVAYLGGKHASMVDAGDAGDVLASVAG